ncbi:MAG: hypothetical protein ACRCSN_05830 [Dermatophilaceae bacterium]
MVQTKPGWPRTWLTEKPAAVSAASPDDGSPAAQRVTTPLPVSTTTVTPVLPEQAAATADGAPARAPTPVSIDAAISTVTRGRRAGDRLTRGSRAGGTR